MNEPSGRMYAECWHPDSPGVRMIIRPGLLRRLGVNRSQFATTSEVLRKYKQGRHTS